MMDKLWGKVTKGTRVVCPRDQVVETVSFCRKYVGTKVVVRTSRHDHYVDRAAEVTVVKGEAR